MVAKLADLPRLISLASNKLRIKAKMVYVLRTGLPLSHGDVLQPEDVILFSKGEPCHCAPPPQRRLDPEITQAARHAQSPFPDSVLQAADRWRRLQYGRIQFTLLEPPQAAVSEEATPLPSASAVAQALEHSHVNTSQSHCFLNLNALSRSDRSVQTVLFCLSVPRSAYALPSLVFH
mmetsp:Transcript_42454/g.92303  ORF Transcript_42454/g.92303 Transcript_42454/m.92303 type:complete len:177 (+) Transcript_42454:441-971(+)